MLFILAALLLLDCAFCIGPVSEASIHAQEDIIIPSTKKDHTFHRSGQPLSKQESDMESQSIQMGADIDDQKSGPSHPRSRSSFLDSEAYYISIANFVLFGVIVICTGTISSGTTKQSDDILHDHSLYQSLWCWLVQLVWLLMMGQPPWSSVVG